MRDRENRPENHNENRHENRDEIHHGPRTRQRQQAGSVDSTPAAPPRTTPDREEAAGRAPDPGRGVTFYGRLVWDKSALLTVATPGLGCGGWGNGVPCPFP